MSLLGGWILVPLAFAALTTGLGLLAERAAGARLPAALIPAVGLAALVVVASVPVAIGNTAPAAVPLVAALAVAGFVLRRRDVRERREWIVPALTALGAFLVYAAPSLLSGQGSIPGWIKLDDSAIWLAITNHVLDSGPKPDLSVISSYGTTLTAWLNTGYPYGTFLPLGVTGELTRQDLANAYTPVIASLAAILALGLKACIDTVVDRPRLSAGAALIAVQASLLFGYAQWGGIKEICVAALLAPAAWLACRGERGTTALTAIAAGALVCGLGTAAAPWVLPILLVAAVTAWRRRPRVAELAGAFVVLAAVAIPLLVSFEFLRQTVENSGTDQDAMGNLAAPLSLLQGIGLWPQGDFRTVPAESWVAEPLAVAGFAAAAGACALAAMRGRLVMPVLLGVVLVGSVAGLVVGGPWIDAKVLAIASAYVLAATATAAAMAMAEARAEIRAAGLAGGLVLAVVVAWSTLLVVRDVNVAARESLAELHEIGEQLDGLGPTLQTNFNIYGDRWFLRDADADGATDLRTRSVSDHNGQAFPEQGVVDVDRIRFGDLDLYRAVVQRRSPSASRPPAAFGRLFAGDWWESWVRLPDAPRPLAHLSLGDDLNPVAVPSCDQVRGLARTAGARRLVAAQRPAPLVIAVDGAGVPSPWRTTAGAVPVVDGTASMVVELPRAGEWRVWVGGSIYGELTVRAGERDVGTMRHQLAYNGEWMRFGTVRLPAGRQVVQLRYERGRAAGRHRGRDQTPLGPIALTDVADERGSRPVEVSVRRARALCDGRTYDWVEALG